jgi:hypothetical protein
VQGFAEFAGVVGLDDSAPNAHPAVITGYKAARNRPLTCGQKLSDKALAAVRARSAPTPKGATALVRALLVLTNREVSRRPMIYAEVIRPRSGRALRPPPTPDP